MVLDRLDFTKTLLVNLETKITNDELIYNQVRTEDFYDHDHLEQARDYILYCKAIYESIENISKHATIGSFDWEAILDARYEFFQPGEPDNFDVCDVTGDVPFHPR
jgi:hypothetical protein